MPRHTAQPTSSIREENIAKVQAAFGGGVSAPAPEPSITETLLAFGRALSPGPSAVAPIVEKFKKRREKDRNRRSFELAVALRGNFQAGELDDQKLLADMARSLTFEAKRAKFKDTFPKGELGEVGLASGELTLVFTKDLGSQPFQELNIPGPSAANIGDIAGTVISEPVLMGTAGSLSGNPLITGAMVAAGVFTQDIIENLRGFPDQEPLETAFRGVVEGGAATALDAATRGISRFLGGIRDKGFRPPFELAVGGERAIQAADELGLEPLRAGQLARNPTIRAMYYQAGGTSPIVKEADVAQAQSVQQALAARGATDITPASTVPAIATAMGREEAKMDKLLPSFTFRSPGDAARRAQLELKGTLRRMAVNRDARYERAFKLSDDVAYDLSSTRAVVADVRKPTLTHAPPSKKFPEGEVIEIPRSMDPRLEKILDTIEAMDPNVVGFATTVKGKTVTSNPYDVVKDLRTKLFNIEGSAAEDIVKRDALLVRKALTDAMNNPTGGSKAFVAAHREAAVYHRFLETQREKLVVIELLSKDPRKFDAVVERIISPGHFSELTVLNRLLTPRGMTAVRDRFKSSLLEQSETPGGIDRVLSGFRKDRGSLALLLTPDEYQTFLAYGRGKTRLMNSTPYRIMQQELEEGSELAVLVESGTAREIQLIADNPSTRQAWDIRTALYKKILDTAETRTGGVLVADVNAVEKAATAARKSGRFASVMGPEDWRAIENFEIYGSVSGQVGPDVGGLMKRGAIVSALMDPTRFVRFVGGLRAFFGNALTARILAVPVSREMAQRGAGSQVTANRLRLMLVAAAVAMEERFFEGF